MINLQTRVGNHQCDYNDHRWAMLQALHQALLWKRPEIVLHVISLRLRAVCRL